MKTISHIPLILLLVLCGFSLQAQQFFFSSEKPTTCGAADGIITIVPTQGTPPFSYQWSTGATSISARNCVKGTYTATLTDATGSTVVSSYILNSKELDLYLADSKPSTYCTPNSGALTIQTVGGTAPYTYLWSNGQTGATAQGLAFATYTVTVQDALGCSASGEFVVPGAPNNYYPYSTIEAVSLPNCSNATAGEIKAVMAGSEFLPYTYVWDFGSTNQTIVGVPVGTYSVTITDGLGCPRTATYSVRNDIQLTANTICSGSTTGTASALLTGGVAPITYVWNTGQTVPNLQNLQTGSYAVTASDASGCSASGSITIQQPVLNVQDGNAKCFTGNNATGYCWVNGDQATGYLWDNGATTSSTNTLSPGIHTVTVTTSLGCSLVQSVSIAPATASPIQIAYSIQPANCTTNTGGKAIITITGGFPPYNFTAYSDNFYTTDIASMQNVQAGTYQLSVSSFNYYCAAYTSVNIPDVSGFSPHLSVNNIDCVTGYGSAAIDQVTAPGTQYIWSTGSTAADIQNLTPGCYTVTVTNVGACLKSFNFCLYNQDSIQLMSQCGGIATGSVYDDLGVSGCTGSTGIPFQLIRTQPSGALNMTDENGKFEVVLPQGPSGIETVNYDPADIACPPTGKYALNAAVGTTTPNLDFHFFNSNPTDHRVWQKPLRTAQPGYPFSIRYQICNDGNSNPPGTLELQYGNFLGSASPVVFSQHAGAFALTGETPGTPDNTADFSFPGITPGGCELLQLDFTTAPTTVGNTEFFTKGSVSPTSGDPTPANNTTSMLNTVVGSFDPNGVLAYPARNGNPHDGGNILKDSDQKITYQISFQNTGTAAANTVIIRDTIDQNLNLASIRNVSTSHKVKVSIENNNVLVFRFPNINLPDSKSNYASSIGSVQYEIDRKPGLQVGTQIQKQAAIYFDFNSQVITNRNVLKITAETDAKIPAGNDESIVVYPNPSDAYFGFNADSMGELVVFNTLGAVVLQQHIEQGLQRITATNLPNGVYMIQLSSEGKKRNGKVVVSH